MPELKNRSKVRRCALLFVLAAAPGCYTFTPVTDVRSGADVRAQLNVEAAVRRSQASDEPMRYIDGRVVEYGPQALSLDVLIARSESVFQGVTIRDTVTIQTSEIEAIYQRRLSVWRTALVTVGVVGGAVAVVSGISTIVGGNEDDTDPGTPNLVVPVFSIGRSLAFRVFGFALRR